MRAAVKWQIGWLRDASDDISFPPFAVSLSNSVNIHPVKFSRGFVGETGGVRTSRDSLIVNVGPNGTDRAAMYVAKVRT